MPVTKKGIQNTAAVELKRDRQGRVKFIAPAAVKTPPITAFLNNLLKDQASLADAERVISFGTLLFSRDSVRSIRNTQNLDVPSYLAGANTEATFAAHSHIAEVAMVTIGMLRVPPNDQVNYVQAIKGLSDEHFAILANNCRGPVTDPYDAQDKAHTLAVLGANVVQQQQQQQPQPPPPQQQQQQQALQPVAGQQGGTPDGGNNNNNNNNIPLQAAQLAPPPARRLIVDDYDTKDQINAEMVKVAKNKPIDVHHPYAPLNAQGEIDNQHDVAYGRLLPYLLHVADVVTNYKEMAAALPFENVEKGSKNLDPVLIRIIEEHIQEKYPLVYASLKNEALERLAKDRARRAQASSLELEASLLAVLRNQVKIEKLYAGIADCLRQEKAKSPGTFHLLFPKAVVMAHHIDHALAPFVTSIKTTDSNDVVFNKSTRLVDSALRLFQQVVSEGAVGSYKEGFYVDEFSLLSQLAVVTLTGANSTITRVKRIQQLLQNSPIKMDSLVASRFAERIQGALVAFETSFRKKDGPNNRQPDAARTELVSLFSVENWTLPDCVATLVREKGAQELFHLLLTAALNGSRFRTREMENNALSESYALDVGTKIDAIIDEAGSIFSCLYNTPITDWSDNTFVNAIGDKGKEKDITKFEDFTKLRFPGTEWSATITPWVSEKFRDINHGEILTAGPASDPNSIYFLCYSQYVRVYDKVSVPFVDSGKIRSRTSTFFCQYHHTGDHQEGAHLLDHDTDTCFLRSERIYTKYFPAGSRRGYPEEEFQVMIKKTNDERGKANLSPLGLVEAYRLVKQLRDGSLDAPVNGARNTGYGNRFHNNNNNNNNNNHQFSRYNRNNNNNNGNFRNNNNNNHNHNNNNNNNRKFNNNNRNNFNNRNQQQQNQNKKNQNDNKNNNNNNNSNSREVDKKEKTEEKVDGTPVAQN